MSAQSPPAASEQSDNLRPIGLRLEPETIQQLRLAYGGKPGAKLSDEIRKRLRWSIEIDPIDDATREFLKDVALLAAEIQAETGSTWHSHRGAYIALRQAILSRLARLEPKHGDMTFGPRRRRTGPHDAPQEIGIWAEYDVNSSRNLSIKARKNYRQLKESAWQEIVRLHGEKNEGQS